MTTSFKQSTTNYINNKSWFMYFHKIICVISSWQWNCYRIYEFNIFLLLLNLCAQEVTHQIFKKRYSGSLDCNLYFLSYYLSTPGCYDYFSESKRKIKESEK